ncbi:MAG TPA: AAA family ATPase, partial [Gammaproteobacteria bacterium]|nr:AAA family ATPase [Gammaproteobacteria bacterium]
MASGEPLLQALQEPGLYDHPVAGFEVIETHISWILLTGSYAYKIKKPVDLGFLDFSTLEKRRYYCQQELRLNRRTAPQLYMQVVTLTGSPERPVLNGGGEPFEYMVKMVQFPQERLLDRLLQQRQLGPGHMDRLAAAVADFHDRIAVAPLSSAYGTPEAVQQPVRENFRGVRQSLDDPALGERLDDLQAWSEALHETLLPIFDRRRRKGFVRECHGDLHLGNIADLAGRITPFDCIEFNERLRWIDVMSEVAFTVMDLEDRERPELAARFLDGYLYHTGDYGGLRVLAYYKGYRAMVRAKVAAIRLGQNDLEPGARRRTMDLLESYIGLAERYTRPVPQGLFITHGPSGAGKTTLTQPLLESLGAVRLRSDVERKRLYGLAPEADSGSAVGGGIYSRGAGTRTYSRLAELAE